MSKRRSSLTPPVAEVAFAPKYGSVRRLLDSEIAVSRMLDYFCNDPDEMLLKAGIPRWRLRSLEMDDEVAQCIETRKDAATSLTWRLEPNQTRPSAFIRDTIKPHVENLIDDVMDAVFYGYSVQEVMYVQDGGKIGVERIRQKPMEWFQPKTDGSLRYFPETGEGGLEGIVCDPRKFLFAVRKPKYRSPMGDALLSRLYFPVTWRREGWFMWLHFMETFGDPIVLGQVPDFKSFVEAMKAQGVRSTIAWQSTSDRDKVDTITASTPGEFERLENAITRRIQKLLLGQTLTSDVSSSGGSYAQAAVHNQVRHDKLRADVRMIVRVIQNLVDVLCDLNRFAPIRFVLEDESGFESQRAARDALLFPVLSGSGFKLTRNYFTDVYDYRDEDLDDGPSPNETLPPVQDIPTDPNAPMMDRSVAGTGPEADLAKQDKPVGAPSAIQEE